MHPAIAQIVSAPLLRRSMWSGLILAGMLLVSGACWVWLQAAGDRGAAEGVRGVLIVTLVALALDVLALVALLAYAELKRSSGAGTEFQSLEPHAAPTSTDA